MSLKQLVFWFLLMAGLAGLWQLLALPNEMEIKLWLKDLLANYGIWFVLIGSLLEALFLIGIYFPGSLLIFIAVATADNLTSACIMILAVTAGVLVGYCANYALGRYGWYKVLMKIGLSTSIEKAKVKVLENDLLYILTTYWNPAFASITATACGIVKLPLRRFFLLSLCGSVAWNIFWGVLVYNLGEMALSIISTKMILSFLFVLIVVALFRSMRMKSDKNLVV